VRRAAISACASYLNRRPSKDHPLQDVREFLKRCREAILGRRAERAALRAGVR
jgi:hypothetical protein